ncbi:MAG: beta-ketoacyl-ACP synthase II [Saprospiraceae bacterium]
MKRIVITGSGAITPLGNTVAEYVEGLKAGRSGAANITLFDATDFKTRFACEVKDFDLDKAGVDKREARRMDRFAQFAMGATHEALGQAGIQNPDHGIDPARIAVIYGSGIGGLGSLQNEIEANVAPKIPRHNPFMIPKMISDIAAGLISMKYGFTGINFATVSACATANHAVMCACDAIKLGKADIVVTGGAEAAITRTGLGGFSSMKALSPRNDDPATASRPYDGERDGFVLGEGAGTLVLEELEHAKKRGATILCEVVGTSATADAHHITAPHPEGKGASNAMRLALAEAGLTTADVQYVNTHGTSTPLGDIAELKAVMNTFGADVYNLNISSTKSMTGHLLGAAGAVEAIAGIAAIHDGFIPPTINHFVTDPNIDPKLNLTFNQPQERKVDVVLSNGFGFGGHNAVVILKRFEG